MDPTENSVSIHLATNLPAVTTTAQQPTPLEKDTLDESNLSALYNRIMSEHKQQPVVTAVEENKIEVSMVESEFNPPTNNQKIGTSVLFKQEDLTF